MKELRRCAMVILGLGMLLGSYSPAWSEIVPGEKEQFPRYATVSSIFYGIWQDRYGSGGKGEEKLIADLKDMHFNRVWLIGYGTSAWLAEKKGFNVGKFLELAEKNRMKVVIYNCLTLSTKYALKGQDYTCSGKMKGIACVNKPIVREHVRDKIKKIAGKWGKYKSFIATTDDETDIFGRCGYCDVCKGKFREWLRANYGREKLSSHGINDITKIEVPKDKSNLFLYYAHQRFVTDSHAQYLLWINNTFKELCPDKKFFVCFSDYTYRHRPLFGSRAQLPRVVDGFLSQSSYRFGLNKTGYYYELYSSGQIEHLACVHFAFYPIEHLAPDIWQTVMHADGVLYYSCAGIYHDFRPKYKRTDKPSRWHGRDKSKGMIPEKVKAIKKVNADIAKCDPYIHGAKTVPAVAIGVVELDNFESHDLSVDAGKSLYFDFFVNRHIPVQVVYLDYITEQSISKHKVLLVPNGQSLSNKALKVIEGWVKKGGILLCSKDVSTKDELSLDRKDYGLKEVLGVSRKDGQIKITTAKVAAGDREAPVILSNDYGKGRSVLFMEGLDSYAKGQKSVLLKKTLDSGMKKVGIRYPLLITKGGEGIEANVRQKRQDKRLTRVLYLLKIKDSAATSGIEAQLEVPAGYKVEDLIAPIRGEKLSYKEKAGYVVFNVPAFELYEAVVLRLVKE